MGREDGVVPTCVGAPFPVALRWWVPAFHEKWLYALDSYRQATEETPRWAMGDDAIMNEGAATARWERKRWGVRNTVAMGEDEK